MSDNIEERTKLFLQEYKSLCTRHQLELECVDPYCGLGVVKLEATKNSPKFCPISNMTEHYGIGDE